MYAKEIDKEHFRVVTTWGPVVSDAALMAYQKSVWSDPAVRGFDELIDFRGLEKIEVTTEGLEAVAHAAAGMDDPIEKPLCHCHPGQSVIWPFPNVRSLPGDACKIFPPNHDFSSSGRSHGVARRGKRRIRKSR
jgi:hypothetical protein